MGCDTPAGVQRQACVHSFSAGAVFQQVHFLPRVIQAGFSALDHQEFLVIEGSGGDAGSFSQVSGHQSLPINAQCVWTDTSI